MTTHARLRSLKRLAAVYESVEYTDGRALDRARVALYEVELLLQQQSDLARSVSGAGRDALVRDDCLEWLMSESQIEFALWHRTGLETLRSKRTQDKEQAAELYRQSLLHSNQIDALVEKERVAASIDQERRAQAATDDRYLSRGTLAGATHRIPREDTLIFPTIALARRVLLFPATRGIADDCIGRGKRGRSQRHRRPNPLQDGCPGHTLRCRAQEHRAGGDRYRCLGGAQTRND